MRFKSQVVTHTHCLCASSFHLAFSSLNSKTHKMFEMSYRRPTRGHLFHSREKLRFSPIQLSPDFVASACPKRPIATLLNRFSCFHYCNRVAWQKRETLVHQDKNHKKDLGNFKKSKMCANMQIQQLKSVKIQPWPCCKLNSDLSHTKYINDINWYLNYVCMYLCIYVCKTKYINYINW